jgi:hypothetical protein
MIANRNDSMVEAAGVEPDNLIETAQLIDSEIARIGLIAMSAKSTVRPLYGLFPEFQQLPNPTSDDPLLRKEHSEAQSYYFIGPMRMLPESRVSPRMDSGNDDCANAPST